MNVLKELLICLNISHTDYYVNKIFNEHPDNDNFFGLKKLLEIYGISSKGIHFVNKDLAEITFPCVFSLSNIFIVGIDCTETSVLFKVDGKVKKMIMKDFNALWTGNVLLIDNYKNGAEPDFSIHKKISLYEKFIATSTFIIPFFLSLAICFERHIVFSSFPLLGLSLVGIIVCILLLKRQIQKTNTVAYKVCSLFKQSNCNKVTESNRAYILHNVSWSEVGYAFFVTNYFIDLCIPQSFLVLTTINVFAMFFGVWSVYYQARVVKSWCILCLTVQFIIWLSGAYRILLMMYDYELHISSIRVFISTILFFFMNVLVVHFTVQYFYSKIQMSFDKKQLNNFLLDKDVFYIKLYKSKRFVNPKPFSSIVWGNPESEILITIILNPHCNPCAELFKKVDKMFSNFRNDIAIQLFIVSSNEEFENDIKYMIAVWLQNDYETAKRLYREWFYQRRNMRLEELYEKDYDINDIGVINERENQKKWLRQVTINTTPSIIINGWLIPKEYTIEDIFNIVS